MKKELAKLIPEAIFNGVPVMQDVLGIEAFDSSDVFDYLRKGPDCSYHGPGYDEGMRERAKAFTDDELREAINFVLTVLYEIGALSLGNKLHKYVNPEEFPDHEYVPEDMAYEMRDNYIHGPYPETRKDKPNYSKCEDCGEVFDPEDEEGIANHHCPKESL